MEFANSIFGRSKAVWLEGDECGKRVGMQIRTSHVSFNGGSFNVTSRFGDYKQSKNVPHSLTEFVEFRALQWLYSRSVNKEAKKMTYAIYRRRGGIARALPWPAVLCAALLLSVVSATYAAHPYERWAEDFGIDVNVSYDGTRLMKFDGQTMQFSEKRTPGKMSTQIQMQGMSSTVLLREDLGKSFMIMPSMGYYREQPLKDGLMQASSGLKFSKIEAVGDEVINGHPSKKFKTKFKDKDGKGAGFIWITETGIPMKMDMIYSSRKMKGKRLSSEFVELHLREQNAADFELPPGLKPMNMGSLAQFLQNSQQAAAGEGQNAPQGQGDGLRKAIGEGLKGIFKR